MSAEVKSKRCCDWSREAVLFLLAASQLQAEQVRRVGEANINLLLISIALSARPRLFFISECEMLFCAYLWNFHLNQLIDAVH